MDGDARVKSAFHPSTSTHATCTCACPSHACQAHATTTPRGWKMGTNAVASERRATNRRSQHATGARLRDSCFANRGTHDPSVRNDAHVLARPPRTKRSGRTTSTTRTHRLPSRTHAWASSSDVEATDATLAHTSRPSTTRTRRNSPRRSAHRRVAGEGSPSGHGKR